MDRPPLVAHLTYQVETSMGSIGTPPAIATEPRYTTLQVSTSAQYVWTDPRFGERREMVKIVPPVSLDITPKVEWLPEYPVPHAGKIFRWDFKATSLVNQPVDGTVKARVDFGEYGVVDVDKPLHLALAGDSATIHFSVPCPYNIASDPDHLFGGYVELTTPGLAAPAPAKGFGPSLTRIDYSHIRPHNIYRPATNRFFCHELTIPKDLKVAYISGPGTDEEVIDALKQLGCNGYRLTEKGLAESDLSQYDTIFVGVRAYEVRPDLVAHNQRLLDYVKAGGTLVVMYQKAPFAKMNCAPAPFKYSEPHDRVTEEDAPVKILLPEHPLFTTPNKIGETDFKGWVQDRGLYFFAEDGRDPGYQALLSCHDKGEPDKTGGLLDYKLGKGHWVYCAYALHLQIPQAVPGTWGILANLASYGRVVKEQTTPAPTEPPAQ